MICTMYTCTLRCIHEKDDGNSKPSYYWLTKNKDNHVVTPWTKRSPRPPSGVAALEHDLVDFTRTFEVTRYTYKVSLYIKLSEVHERSLNLCGRAI
jgi:hypothetical protein